MIIYIINGPNLNLLGVREPEVYGNDTYETLTQKIRAHCEFLGIDAVIYQSNHEGDLVDKIHEAYTMGAEGIVINPAAYTHTSIALLDAVKATSLKCVEVHISDVSKREAFRQVSYIREACIATISGHGILGYLEAIDLIVSESGNES